MDGYHQHEKGGEFVTYARLRVMGTNGFRSPRSGVRPPALSPPAVDWHNDGRGLEGTGHRGARGKEPVQKKGPQHQRQGVAGVGAAPSWILGTKRLYADGKFNSKDGKAKFMETQWRGLQAPGKEDEMKKFPFLINNGRANITWQSSYLDQDNEFVTDRTPYPYSR